MKKETIVRHRKYFSFNHESEGHDCGLKQGESPPCELNNSKEVDAIKIGQRVTHFYAAPGSGTVTYCVTRIDEEGAWGVRVAESFKMLRLEDVK